MQFAKYIKEHPLPPLTREQISAGLKQEARKLWENDKLYTAFVVDGVLNVVVYGKGENELVPTYRHIFDGDTYATLRYSDGKKLSGTIFTYLSYYYKTALDKASEKTVCSYLGNENGLRALKAAEQEVLDRKRDAAHQKIKDKIDARLASIKDPPPELFDWLKNTVFKPYRYFFYNYKRGKTQHGYCSHCKAEFDAAVKYKDITTCPKCGSELTCRALGRISKYPFGHSFNVEYADRAVDGDDTAIVLRVFYATLSISRHRDGAAFCKESFHFSETARYFHDIKDYTRRLSDDGDYMYVYGTFKNDPGKRWCSAETGHYVEGYLARHIIYPPSTSALRDILWLKNVDLETISEHTDYIENLVDRLRVYPVIENLIKHGKYKIADELLNNRYWECDKLLKACNTNERSPLKFLKVDRPTFAALGDIPPKEFILFANICDVNVFRRAVDLGLNNVSETFGMAMRNTGVKPAKLIGYLEKQTKLSNRKGSELLTTYIDYQSMVGDLKMKRTESVDFPKDLQKEHDRLMKLKTDKIYTKQNPKLKKRGELLHTLDWTDGTFIIRAFDDASDFLTESAVLGHCVKTYIDRCAKGETNIFGIRQANRPDVPFYTLTLSNTCKVTQNLGKHNCIPTDDVKRFVNKWKKKVLDKYREEFIKNATKTTKARKTA